MGAADCSTIEPACRQRVREVGPAKMARESVRALLPVGLGSRLRGFVTAATTTSAVGWQLSTAKKKLDNA